MKFYPFFTLRSFWKRLLILIPLLLVSATVLLVTSVSAAPVGLTATKTAAFIGGDGDGKADPGETIEYTVTVNNPTVSDVTNTSFGDNPDTNTTLVPGSIAASPAATNDTFPVTVVGNVSIDSAALASPFSVTTNDFMGVNPLATIDMVQAVTTISANTITAGTGQGGNVVMTVSGANMGKFTYDPPAGYEGTDTFTYRLTDNANAPIAASNRTATVSITVSGMVWFINNGASACIVAGCGRLSNPFSTLAAFNTLNDGTGNHPAANDNIFIYESATNYTGGVTLLSGQKLIGQDSSSTLATITGLTPPTGSSAFPTMNTAGNATTIVNAAGNGVTVNSGNTLNGFTAGNASGSAISGSGFGTLTVADVIVNTTGQALNLTNGTLSATFSSVTSSGGTNNIALAKGAGVLAGTLTMSGGALSGATGNAFDVNGGTAAISYAGTIASGSAHSVNVTNLTGGMVTFSGAVTDTDTGINLTTNTGATINFQGGLVSSTGANTAFTATGGGTVNVCDENPCNPAATGALVNTLTTTTGAALNMTFTNIGSNNLEFKSISSNGAANGIVLSNTGSSGRLTVKGDGTTNTCKTGTTTCSGGTIQSSTGDGISLTSTKVNLSLMWIKNNANSGIKGTTLSGFTATDILVQNNTNAAGEQAGILINDLTDSSAQVTRAEVSGSKEDNVRIHNSSTTGTITFTSCTIIDNDSNPVGAGNQGIFFQTNTTGNLTGTVTNSTLHGNRTIALRGDSGDGSTLSATFTNNTITAGSPNQGNQGIEVSRAGTSTLTFNVTGNTVSGMISTLINVFSGGGPGTATGDVKNNIVTGVGVGGNQFGIRLFNSGSSATGFGTMNVNVANNTVTAIDNAYPILGESSGSTGTPTSPNGLLKIALTGNTANVASGGTALDSIRVQSRNNSSVCAVVNSNTTNSGGPGFFGIQLREANTSTFNLEGLTTGAQTDPTVHNYVVAQNPTGGTVGTLAAVGNSSINGVSSCGVTAMAPLRDTNRGVAIQQETSSGDDAQAANALDDSANGFKQTSFTFPLDEANTEIAPATNSIGVAGGHVSQPQLAPTQTVPVVSVTIGTMPAGKSVIIKFRVTVNGPSLPLGTFQLSNQGTVNYAPGQTKLTDDPGVGGASDPTITPVDRPDTTVSSINTDDTNPTNAASVSWDVTFPTVITGLTASNLSLVNTGLTGTPAISTVTPVGGSPATVWTVTASTGTGQGTLGLNMVNDTGLSHDVTNLTFTGQVYNIDHVAPTTTSFTRQTPSTTPTKADTLVFRATFSEAVTAIDTGDFAVNGTTTATVTNVAFVSAGVYDVTVSGGDLASFNGVVGLNFSGGMNITDLAGNALANTEPATDQTYTEDNTAPDTSILTQPTNPSNSTSASFTFSGSDPGGSGVASFECDLDGGGFSACTSAKNYTSLSQGSHTFQVRAIDNAGNTDATPVSYTWKVDTTKPDVTINQAGTQADPTSASPIHFTAVFNEPVTGFGNSAGDVTLGGTALATTAVVTEIAPNDGTTYDVAVSGMSVDGTVAASIPSGAAADPATNTNNASTSTNNTVTFASSTTTVTINQAGTQADPTNASPINFTAVFNVAVTGFGDSAGDVTLGGTAGPTSAVVTEIAPMDGTTYNVAVSGMASDGTVTASIPSNVVTGGNQASTSTDNTVTRDTLAPDTTITANPLNPSSVNTADFSFNGSDPGGSGVASFECDLDGGGFSACTSTKHYSGLSDGSHTFQVRAIDNAGNTDPTPAPYTWVVDTTAPDTSILTQPTNPSNSTSASFTFNGSDPGGSGVASFECDLDGGGFSACTSAKNYTSLSQGSHTFQVRAIDNAGNKDLTPDSYTWKVDTTKPDVSINQAATQTDPTAAASIHFTAVFNEPVTGFGDSAGDVTIGGTASPTTAIVTEIAPNDGTTYDVAVSGMSGNGTVTASIPLGIAADAATNTNNASTSTDNTVTYDVGAQSGPTFTVNVLADTDDGACDTLGTGIGNKDCTLREAINAANGQVGANTINFSVSGTILLSGSLPAINDDVTIDGTGQAVVVSGATLYRVMSVNSAKTLNLNALTIENGYCNGCNGGGILNSGTLNVTNSTFATNVGTQSGGGGGGIGNLGTLNVTNSTFAGNAANLGGHGGGIYNFTGTATIRNSTFAGNAANGGGSGGGIYNLSTLTLYNTIVANSSSGGDCDSPSGTFTADAFNLDSDGSCDSATQKTTPQIALVALGSNGGATQTMALGSGSAAIDAGDNTVCAAAPVSGQDQRGQLRNDLHCDVGAFEFENSDGHTVSKDSMSSGNTYTFGPTLAQIALTSGDPGTLTVNREMTTPPFSPPANPLKITWDATATGSPFSFIVTLCYDPTTALTGQNEGTLRVYHYNGIKWVNLGGTLDTVTHAPYHCITAEVGLTTLSPLAIAPGSPTAVNVSALKGRFGNSGLVQLHWKTYNESFITGFNVYRKVATKAAPGKKRWVKLNRDFINAKNPGNPIGSKYRYKDGTIQAGLRYRYRLEIFYSDGHTEWSNVIGVQTNR